MKLYVEHEFIKDFFDGFNESEIKEVLREVQLLVSKELEVDFIEPPMDDKDREFNLIETLSPEALAHLNSFVDVAVIEIQNIIEDNHVELTGIDKVLFSDTILVFHLKSIPLEDKEEIEEDEEETDDDSDDD